MKPVRSVQIQPQALQHVHDDAVREMVGVDWEGGDAEEAAGPAAVGFVGVVSDSLWDGNGDGVSAAGGLEWV